MEIDSFEYVCIVTGATAGIGKWIAGELARRGTILVLPCRDLKRGEAVRAKLEADYEGARIEVLPLDLSSQSSVHEFADCFLDRYPRLDVLINNAAVWLPERRLSVDKIEQTWATNVLGPHLLTLLLLDALRAGHKARIVNVVSQLAGGLDLTDVEFTRRRYRGVDAYRQSKQALSMLSWTLAERLSDAGVTVNASHPGIVNTELTRDMHGPAGRLVAAYFRTFGMPPKHGAEGPTWLATSIELDGVTGRYFEGKKERPRRFQNPDQQAALWALCCRMTSLEERTV